MKIYDIINVNYTTEKYNTLIFARMGVMQNNKNKVFLYHIPFILGQKNFFSSTKKGWDAPFKHK